MKRTMLYVAILYCLMSMLACTGLNTSTTLNDDAAWYEYVNIEEAGFDKKKMQNIRRSFDSLGGSSVLMVYNGKIVLDWGENTRRFPCASIRKSLLSALIGNAIQRNELMLTSTLEELGIDDRIPLTESEKQATVEDLLTSRSGVYIPAAFEAAVWKKKRPDRGQYKHGEHWYYNNWDFNTLGSLYEKRSNANIFDAFQKEIAVPTAMQDFRLFDGKYFFETSGSQYPAYLFKISARDLARFGQLYLNGGRMFDTQIIPEQWVHQSTTQKVRFNETEGYSYLWWNTKIGKYDCYFASGAGVQGIYILPELNMVFVFRVNSYGRSTVNDGVELRLFKRMIETHTLPEKEQPAVQTAFRDAKPIEIHTVQLPVEYCRSYSHKQFGRFTLVQRDSIAVLETGAADFYLTKNTSGELFAEDVDARIELLTHSEKSGTVELVLEGGHSVARFFK